MALDKLPGFGKISSTNSDGDTVKTNGGTTKEAKEREALNTEIRQAFKFSGGVRNDNIKEFTFGNTGEASINWSDTWKQFLENTVDVPLSGTVNVPLRGTVNGTASGDVTHAQEHQFHREGDVTHAQEHQFHKEGQVSEEPEFHRGDDVEDM